MTTSVSPHDQQLTVRDAYELYYPKDELAHRSKNMMRTAIGAWERLTGNVPVHQLTNASIEQFRQACLADGLAPRTTNGYWTNVRSILRRIGPVTEGNPWALDLFPGWRVPAMRPCRVDFKRPRRLSMDELNRLYLAARHMREPYRRIADPVAFWQGLLVFAYYTGLRSADIFKARWSEVDFQQQTIHVITGKTKVEADLPLVDVVMTHLARLYEHRINDFIFPLDRRHLYENLLRRFREQADIKFGLHDLRRTCASELNAVAPGMGKVVLLHAPTNVTERSYLNAIPELRTALEKMVCPIAFRHGPKMTIRSIRDSKKEFLKAQNFAVPIHPPKEIFKFSPTGVSIAGIFICMQSGAITILKALVENDCVIRVEELLDSLGSTGHHSNEKRTAWLQASVLSLRRLLRSYLSLPPGFSPIVGRYAPHTKKGPGSTRVVRYELILPPALWQETEQAS